MAPNDKTPTGRPPQPSSPHARYAELYPSLPKRLKTILASNDPALLAKARAVTAMAARSHGAREDWLAQRYGLTPSEARLAAFMGAGGTVADFAAEHGVSQYTARTHLKAIFAKTGAHRQSELVRLMYTGDR